VVSLLATLALLFAFVAGADAETIAGTDVGTVAGAASESEPVVPAGEEAPPAEVEPAEVATSAGAVVASTQIEVDPAETPDPPATGNATAPVTTPVDSTVPAVRQAVESSSAQIADSGGRQVAAIGKSTTGDVEAIARRGALPDLAGLDALPKTLSLPPSQLLPRLAQTPSSSSDRPAIDGAPPQLPQLGGPLGTPREMASPKAPIANPDLTQPGGVASAWLEAPTIGPGGSRALAIGRTGGASFDSAIDRMGGGASRPNELPPPEPRAPAAVPPASDGPTFVPIAGLLALLALAAPATLRRFGEAADWRPPTPFVCGLERPG
jgi:hypothetical protein